MELGEKLKALRTERGSDAGAACGQAVRVAYGRVEVGDGRRRAVRAERRRAVRERRLPCAGRGVLHVARPDERERVLRRMGAIQMVRAQPEVPHRCAPPSCGWPMAERAPGSLSSARIPAAAEDHALACEHCGHSHALSLAFRPVRCVLLRADATIGPRETKVRRGSRPAATDRKVENVALVNERARILANAKVGPNLYLMELASPPHSGGHRAGAVRAHEGAEHGGAHLAPPVLGIRARRGRGNARDPLPGRGLRHRSHDSHRARARRAPLGRGAYRSGWARLGAACGRPPRSARGRRRGCGPTLHADRIARGGRRAHGRRDGRADRGRAYVSRAIRGVARRSAALCHRRRAASVARVSAPRSSPRRSPRRTQRASRTTTWPYAARSPS